MQLCLNRSYTCDEDIQDGKPKVGVKTKVLSVNVQSTETRLCQTQMQQMHQLQSRAGRQSIPH